MSRTYRRVGCHYDYPFALWQFDHDQAIARTPEVRARLAWFHSDKSVGCRLPAPKIFRMACDAGQRSANRAILRSWMRNPTFEPLFFDARHCTAWLPM